MTDSTVIRPLGKKLLCRWIPPELSHGNIVLPEVLQHPDNLGGPKVYVVLRKGPKVSESIANGDRVVCHSYTTGPVQLNSTLHVISEDQVLAVIPKINRESQ